MVTRIENIEQLLDYRYQVWRYEVSHSVLIIRATPKGQNGRNVHLTFVDVKYVQLPMGWQDGDLRIASEEEFWEVAKKVRFGKLHPLLREVLTLYKAENPLGNIYILGKLAQIEQDVDPLYSSVRPRLD